MKKALITRLAIGPTAIALLVAFLLNLGLGSVSPVFAQDPTATPTLDPLKPTSTELPTATPTNTPPANTPTPTNTAPSPTNTPTQVVTLPPDTPTPNPTATPIPSGPVPIPEPVTVVLFGTGLAALSAALASRRKTGE